MVRHLPLKILLQTSCLTFLVSILETFLDKLSLEYKIQSEIPNPQLILLSYPNLNLLLALNYLI